MTIRLLKSQVPSNFSDQVAKHIAALQDWKAHMQRVADDLKKGVPVDKRHAAFPMPVASSDVESAINQSTLAADYVIIDDTPTSDQVLAAKKSELIQRVSIAEQASIDAVVPPGKRRAFNLRASDISASDGVLIGQITAETGIVKKLATSIGIASSDITSEVAKRRPKADTAFLAEHADRNARIDKISRAAAQMQSDIEDLTSATVDKWVMPEFPK